MKKPKLPRLYEDRDIIAIDKPPGLPSVPIKDSDVPSALSILRAELRDEKSECFIVHRIDRFTSGVLLFAKSKSVHEKLKRQFLSHSPTREYLALVRGDVKQDQATLVHFLKQRNFKQIISRSTDREATRAELRYTVEKRLRGMTLLRVSLVTGLQNQIRVQFSAEGHPLVGDRKYHPEEADERRIDRVALHAGLLSFKHPRSGKDIRILAELPSDIGKLAAGPEIPSPDVANSKGRLRTEQKEAPTKAAKAGAPAVQPKTAGKEKSLPQAKKPAVPPAKKAAKETSKSLRKESPRSGTLKSATRKGSATKVSSKKADSKSQGKKTRR